MTRTELEKRLIRDGLKARPAPKPDPISEARRWLARQLLDPALSDSEAFGIVAYHPSVKDEWK